MDTRNLILAIVLSAGIMIGYELLFAKRPVPPAPPAQQGEQAAPQPAPEAKAPPTAGGPPVPTAAPPSPGGAPTSGVAAAAKDRASMLAAAPRVTIATPRLRGSISLEGGRLDDLELANYHEEVDPKSPAIVLLSPPGTPGAYFSQFGWVAEGDVKVPGPETPWTADRDTLAPDQPVTLVWDNGENLKFSQTIAVDRDYMVTVSQRVENMGASPVTLHAYGLISRTGTPQVTGFYILHEGLLGVFNGTLKEVKYDELREARTIQQSTTGGWIGITDKYWLAALVPDQTTPTQTRFTHHIERGVDKYQVDILGPAVSVAPGASTTATGRMFAGAKEVVLLDRYADKLGIQRMDLAIDFGWFYFLTKPIFYVLIYLHQHVGNFGVAILIFTVFVKLVFFPLANKSYKAMSKMKKLQPEMLKLRERFGNDRARMNQEMMALYKREKANPASGCLPMVIQIPVFFALYKVLFVTIEMRHAPFFGWIRDLSAADPTTVFNLFGLIPWMPPSFLMIGVWPLVMGGTMLLQQKLNPQPMDPIQAKVFMLMPVVFTALLANFPAGLVIYWAWNNVLSILQQWVIMRRAGVKP